MYVIYLSSGFWKPKALASWKTVQSYSYMNKSISSVTSQSFQRLTVANGTAALSLASAWTVFFSLLRWSTTVTTVTRAPYNSHFRRHKFPEFHAAAVTPPLSHGRNVYGYIMLSAAIRVLKENVHVHCGSFHTLHFTNFQPIQPGLFVSEMLELAWAQKSPLKRIQHVGNCCRLRLFRFLTGTAPEHTGLGLQIVWLQCYRKPKWQTAKQNGLLYSFYVFLYFGPIRPNIEPGKGKCQVARQSNTNVSLPKNSQYHCTQNGWEDSCSSMFLFWCQGVPSSTGGFWSSRHLGQKKASLLRIFLLQSNCRDDTLIWSLTFTINKLHLSMVLSLD